VKSNREKVTSVGLEGKGYDVFLPQYRRETSLKRYAKDVPLFPGYLFCRFDVNKRLPILTLPGIVQIVGFGNVPTPIDETEVASLKVLLQAGLPVDTGEAYYVGQRIRISAGPLSGALGTITGLKQKRLVVSITLLQRSVSVELQHGWVDPQ
jgi:transcription antitermination factor NusG